MDDLLLLLHGPSTNNVIPLLDSCRERGMATMSVNQYFHALPDFSPDYVLCNYPFKEVLGYEDNADRGVHYFFHFSGEEERKRADDLGFDYEEYYYQARESGTVQEKLKELSGYHRQATQGASVVVPAMCAAVLMRPRRLFYIGVEMDYRLRYAGDRTRRALETWSHNNSIGSWEEAGAQFDRLRPGVLKDIRVIKNSAALMGIEVRNLTWEFSDNVSNVLFN